MTASTASLVGNAPIRARLERLRRDATLPHALLLAGPDGVGKTSVAFALAAAVLDAGGWPGGLRAHPDLWLEDGPGERIGIDRIRAGGGDDESGPSLQETLSRLSYAGGPRVAVIGRADRLTEQASNCLLKTLEEPPPRTHLLLCAGHPERLPATILSRCQSVALAPVPIEEIAAWLSAAHGVEGGLATTAAALSGGRPGRALGLATAPESLAVELGALDALLAAGGGGRAAALAAAGDLSPPNTGEGRERALAQLAAWTTFVRDVAVIAAGAPELAVWPLYRAAAAHWAEVVTAERAAELLARCVETADQVAQYAVPRLAFEVLLLDILTGPPAPPRVIPPPRPAGVPEGRAAPLAATTRRRGPARRR